MESIFRSDNQLVWMAEYNDACIQQLRKRIGPSDEAVSDARRLIDSNPSILKNIQEKATLDIVSTSVGPMVKAVDLIPAILHVFKERNISYALKTLKTETVKLSKGRTVVILLSLFLIIFYSITFRFLSSPTDSFSLSFQYFAASDLNVFTEDLRPIQHVEVNAATH